MKPIFKKVKRTIIDTIAYCPKCGTVLTKITDYDALTIMTYHCEKCNYCW